jgi:hypothetical protein
MQAIKGLKGDNADQDAGISIVLPAMEEPLRIIVSNAGDEASVVVNAVLASKGNNGYNAATGEYGDLVAQGVIDPTKVTKTALVNAASVAALLLTTDCTRSSKNEEGHQGWQDSAGLEPALSITDLIIKNAWSFEPGVLISTARSWRGEAITSCRPYHPFHPYRPYRAYHHQLSHLLVLHRLRNR